MVIIFYTPVFGSTSAKQRLKRCHHSIKSIKDILPSLGKAKIFSKVNCSNGYWQVPLDEESSLLTTFHTLFG